MWSISIRTAHSLRDIRSPARKRPTRSVGYTKTSALCWWTRCPTARRIFSQPAFRTTKSGDAEIAGVGSGAGDHIVDLTGAAGTEAKFAQGGVDLRQARQRKVRQDHVLVDGGAQQAIAGGGGKPRQAAQLIAGQVALIDGHGDGRIPRLLLLLHVAGEPSVVGCVAGRRLVEHRQQGAVAERLRVGLVSAEALGHYRRPLDAAVLQDIVVLFGDLLLHPGEAAVAHHELHARGVLVLAVAVLIEDADNGFAPVEQALFGDELVEQLGFGRRSEERRVGK